MPRRPTSLLLLAAVMPVLGGCAARTASLDRLPSREYRGHVTTTGGAFWFRPCAQPTDSLWVTFTGASVAQRDAARAGGAFGAGARTYVRWMAAVTDARHVGPGGPALLVRDIAEARPAGDADCGG